tara:strand:- start:83 stop:190 length:108 start_codon:yes stop_codon:yes gene_type:complete
MMPKSSFWSCWSRDDFDDDDSDGEAFYDIFVDGAD